MGYPGSWSPASSRIASCRKHTPFAHTRNLSVVNEGRCVGSTGIGSLLVSRCSLQHAESFFDPSVGKTDTLLSNSHWGLCRWIPNKRLLSRVLHQYIASRTRPWSWVCHVRMGLQRCDKLDATAHFCEAISRLTQVRK